MSGAAISSGFEAKLCGNCLSIFNPILRAKFGMTRNSLHPSLASFQASLAVQCYICVRVAEEWFQDYWCPGRAINPADFLSSEFKLDDRKFTLRVFSEKPNKESGGRSTNYQHHNFSFDIIRFGDLTQTSEASFATTRAISNGSGSLIALTKAWLTDCNEKHPECIRPTSPEYYPSRLLDLSKARVRLIDCADEKPTGSYATMSHCWGTNRFDVLTPENQVRFQKGVAETSLCKSFRDAILTVQRLGLKYIWIDCFCILQGDSLEARADWARESVNMDRVYKNSYINIGATSANGPTEGCFAERMQPSPLTPCLVRWRPDLQSPEELYRVIPQENRFISAGMKLCHPLRLEENPLFKRAWIYQERLLCPRMVHFCWDQVYWECAHVPIASESCPTGPLTELEHQMPRPFTISTSNFGVIKHPLKQWLRTLEEYTKCHLTYPHKDKLSAIGGVAERFTELLGLRYIGGIWYNHLVSQLLWRGSPSDWPSRRSRIWRAPSWSWAVMDTEINFENLADETKALELVSFLNVHLKPATDGNSYGPLISGSLSLKGRLLPATVGFRSISNSNESLQILSVAGNFKHSCMGSFDDENFDFYNNETGRGSYGVSLLLLQLNGWSSQSHCEDGNKLPDQGLEAVEILKRWNMASKPSGFAYSSVFVVGLVLQRISELNFRRVGLCRDFEPLKMLNPWLEEEDCEIIIV